MAAVKVPYTDAPGVDCAWKNCRGVRGAPPAALEATLLYLLYCVFVYNVKLLVTLYVFISCTNTHIIIIYIIYTLR